MAKDLVPAESLARLNALDSIRAGEVLEGLAQPLPETAPIKPASEVTRDP